MQHDFYPDDLGPESPYFDGVDEDYNLYPGYCPDELNHAASEPDEPEEFDRLFELAEVIDTVRLKGKGKGKQIVGGMAVLLEGEEDYGFEVKFWRLDESEKLPEGWEN